MTRKFGERCQLLLVESDLGGAVAGAAAGPASIQGWLSSTMPVWRRLRPTSVVMDSTSNVEIDRNSRAKHICTIQPLLSAVHRSVSQYFQQFSQHQLMLLSGDHSSACAAVAGLKNAFPGSRIGVIWIDAHADIHTPLSTPSGNLHGMPMGAMLRPTTQAESITPLWQQIQRMCAGALRSEDLVYIGIRDLEAAEWQVLEQLNIRHWTAAQLDQFGAVVVACNTLLHLAEVDFIYLSFDIDALDASIAMATGTPVTAGLTEQQVQTLLQFFLADQRVKLFEVTEYAPALDEQGVTAKVLFRLLTQLLPVSPVLTESLTTNG